MNGPRDGMRHVGSFYEVLEGGSFTVGDPDDPWVLEGVLEVHVVSDGYIVYTAANKRVVFAAEQVYDEHDAFQAGFHEVQALPVTTLTEREQLQLRALLGAAMGAALEGDFDVAEQGLQNARTFACTQAEKHARLHYLMGATLAAALAALIGAAGLAARGGVEDLPYDLATLALIAAIGGALGGMLSVGRRQRGPARFDPLATVGACWLSGGMRVVYASISAFVVLGATHVGLLTTGLIDQLDPLETLTAKVLIATAGGYLESWATHVLGLVGGGEHDPETDST